jgi:sec-independent protein translocase protein TatA
MFEGLFQPMHLLVILFIALLVFGPKRLPELGKGLGEGFRSLRNSMRERENETPTSSTGCEHRSRTESAYLFGEQGLNHIDPTSATAP